MPTDCSVLRTPTTSSCYYSMIFPCLKDFVLCLFQRLLQFSFLVLLLYLKLQPLCLNFDIKNVITIYVKDVGGKSPRLYSTDCYALRAPTILPNIRISWCLRPTFMLILGQVTRSFYRWCASTRGVTLTLVSCKISNLFQINIQHRKK